MDVSEPDVIDRGSGKPASPVDSRSMWPKLRTWGIGALLVLVVGSLWQLNAWRVAASETPLASKKFPYLHDVAIAIFQNWPDLWSAVRTTATGALVGLGIGTTIGVVLALIAGRSRIWESAFYPYVVFGQMVPTIALAPILLAILRDFTITRIVVASYITFFPMSLNVLKGLKSVPDDEAELMASYNSSRRQTLTKLRIPAAAPFFFTGFKIAAPLAVVAEIVVELSGATDGVGYLILITQYYGPQFASLFWAAVILTLLLGVLFYRGAALLERLITPWQPEFRT